VLKVRRGLGDSYTTGYGVKSGSGVISFPAGTGPMVAVANPDNPRQVIWVPARLDADGNLVPVDARYSTALGWNGSAPTWNGVPLTVNTGLVALGICVLLFIVARR
jgi:hypothetical protein